VFAPDREDVVFDRDVDLVGLDAGDCGLDDVAVVGLVDIEAQ
jgi:hypothetical protein